MADEANAFGFDSDDSEEEIIDPSTLVIPLYNAVKSNSTDEVLSLLATGVPVTHSEEWTSLHWSCHHGNVAVTAALLAAGASDLHDAALAAAKANGQALPYLHPLLMSTPLHRAASQGHLQVSHLLLSSGYLLSAVDTLGNTPLHLASSTRRAPLLKCFLSHGGDSSTPNNFKNRPIDVCTDGECRRMLREAGEKGGITEEEREKVMEVRGRSLEGGSCHMSLEEGSFHFIGGEEGREEATPSLCPFGYIRRTFLSFLFV